MQDKSNSRYQGLVPAAIGAGLVFATAYSVSVSAAPFFLKIETIEGETRAASDGHEKWIELDSVTWGRATASSGGINVAAGDVNNRRAAEKKGGNVETTWKVEEGQKAAPRPGAPNSIKAAPMGPGVRAGLLLPAVQKARASMKGSYPDCKVGDHRDQVTATTTDGRTIVLKDVLITSCGSSGSTSGDVVPTDSISFNYSKIEM